MLGQTALGKYRLLRSLGSGANGEVYLAEPIRYPHQRVVVKRVHDHAAEHPKFRQLFQAEVRSMRNFNHPYTVKLLDASVDDPIGPCMVMEYVPGVTLESVLHGGQRLTIERVGRLLGYLGHAIQAAHHAGIIHRDLKPANLMVLHAGQPNETVKVMDFGFAGFVARPHIQLAELTGHGPIFALGTPEYVSPEMVRGDPVDTRSDLYSVGVILFEMLTGRLPFEQPEMEQVLAAHVKLSPPRFRSIAAAHVPAGIEGVVQLALAKYPNERQQTAKEIVDEFSRVLGENFWEDTAPAGWEPTANSGTYIPARTPGSQVGLPRPIDEIQLSEAFEVAIPERLIAAKIRGFVEDVDATVLESEPGLIRLQVGLPSNYQTRSVSESSLFNWFKSKMVAATSVPRGKEPIAIELHMEKPNPSLTRMKVSVACSPVKEYPPRDITAWRERCGKVQIMIRQYLGG